MKKSIELRFLPGDKFTFFETTYLVLSVTIGRSFTNYYLKDLTNPSRFVRKTIDDGDNPFWNHVRAF